MNQKFFQSARLCLLLLLNWCFQPAFAEGTDDYAKIDAIFQKHCVECHDVKDPEANLVLENYNDMMKGGESGVAIVPGKSDESLLVKMLEGKIEKNGKKKIMPPAKKKVRPEASEIAAIKAWIDAGAHGPSGGPQIREIVAPKIALKVAPRNPINALACDHGVKLLALARYSSVELRSAETAELVRTLSGHRGNVNAVVFSPDGSQVFSAAGENAVFGEIKQWNVADGKLLQTFQGHKDTIYSLAISPDGKTLASGSYDQKIILWDIASGKQVKTLSGHNGCVFCLSFRPDGKILASASADRTVKLWDVASGTRRDTFSQPLKDVLAVAFSPDGKKVLGGGVDNRIRIWEVSADAAEGKNPILDSKYAHEGAILRLVFSADGKMLLSSADDRTVKLWDAAGMKEHLLLEPQPDWAAGLDFVGNKIVVGRLDGSLDYYDFNGKKQTPKAVAGNQAEKLSSK